MAYNDFENIDRKIRKCINKIYEKDRSLIDNELHEITISHCLAIYLQTEFPKYDIDLEYNRNNGIIKMIDNNKIRPDIVIHKRYEGTNKTQDNYIVFEVKTKEYKKSRFYNDYKKLRKMTDLKGNYRYKYGVFIYIGDKKDYDKELVYFINGKEIRDINKKDIIVMM